VDQQAQLEGKNGYTFACLRGFRFFIFMGELGILWRRNDLKQKCSGGPLSHFLIFHWLCCLIIFQRLYLHEANLISILI